jgi:hypothetical protein
MNSHSRRRVPAVCAFRSKCITKISHRRPCCRMQWNHGKTQNRQIALTHRVGYFEFGSRLLSRRMISGCDNLI